jgi:hypothetical protein
MDGNRVDKVMIGKIHPVKENDQAAA